MCGIVGCIGHLNIKQEAVFTDMLLLDTIRGPHSTGVLKVTTNKAWHYFKDAVNAYDFCKTEDYRKMLITANRVLIGHNRWATSGKITAENAHPFSEGHIIGFHNGTLTWRSQLPDFNNFEVDSQNIIHSIHKIGVEESWNKIYGAAALVWWDEKEGTVNFLRNRERPLYYCIIEDEFLFFSSEKYIIAAALDRNNMKIPETINSVDINTHYKISFPTKKNKKITIEKKDMIPVRNNHIVTFPYNRYYNEDDGFWGRGTFRNKNSHEKLITFILNKKKIESRFDRYKGHTVDNGKVPVEVFLWSPGVQELTLNKEYKASVITSDNPSKYTVPYSWIVG